MGELGNGTTTDSLVPVPVSGLTDVTAISTSWGYTCTSHDDGSSLTIDCWAASHSCALLADGTVRCWGLNWDGELGNGTTTQSLVPVQVSGLSGVRAIAAGGGQTCAVLTGGTVQCWGYNGNGQLGNGGTLESTVPVPVGELMGTSAISAGYAHACAVLTDGTVRCWGANDYRVRCFIGCGLETLAADSLVPVPVSGLAGVAAISAGQGFTCAALTDGTVLCWGRGPLGNGWTTDSLVPLPVRAPL
jgi:alpha-tubulin suppressor-like RCC1 family protein